MWRHQKKTAENGKNIHKTVRQTEQAVDIDKWTDSWRLSQNVRERVGFLDEKNCSRPCLVREIPFLVYVVRRE